MACTNCLQNCGGQSTSDQCIEYTGDDIPLLGICSGDQLSKVEAAVITALLTSLDGTGIEPTDVTLENCPWLKQQFIGKDPTLANFLQLLIDAECSLKEMIDAISSTNTDNPVFVTTCLSGLPTNPTPTQVLQALTQDYCALKQVVNQIPATYVKNSDLPTLVSQILTAMGITGGSTSIQYAQYIPLKTILPYYGDLGNFDNTGKGLASVGFQGLYLCNGSNDTPDVRGRTFVGAVRNVPGGTLDAAVDPSLAYNPNTNYTLGDRFGENYHTLTTSEIPTHTHGVTDTGHTHTISVFLDDKGKTGGLVDSPADRGHGSSTQSTNSASTGISINSAGGGAFHNNIQPSMAVYYIIRLQ